MGGEMPPFFISTTLEMRQGKGWVCSAFSLL